MLRLKSELGSQNDLTKVLFTTSQWSFALGEHQHYGIISYDLLLMPGKFNGDTI